MSSKSADAISQGLPLQTRPFKQSSIDNIKPEISSARRALWMESRTQSDKSAPSSCLLSKPLGAFFDFFEGGNHDIDIDDDHQMPEKLRRNSENPFADDLLSSEKTLEPPPLLVVDRHQSPKTPKITRQNLEVAPKTPGKYRVSKIKKISNHFLKNQRVILICRMPNLTQTKLKERTIWVEMEDLLNEDLYAARMVLKYIRGLKRGNPTKYKAISGYLPEHIAKPRPKQGCNLSF